MNLQELFANLPHLPGAACVGADPEIFFPINRNDHAPEAKRICRSCPVKRECRDAARQRGEPFGVWGGETEQDRDVPELPESGCGTLAGYSRHRRQREEACPACVQARAAYERDRYWIKKEQTA